MTHKSSIQRLVNDVIRVPCERILLSPDLYHACLDEIIDRCKNLGSIPPCEQLSDVFVRGVQAEKCHSLSGMEYALVPRKRE
jgi:hypothetical protein